MFRQSQFLNDSTLSEDYVLPSVPHPILITVRQLYGVVLMLLFTAVAVVVLFVSIIIGAVLSPKGTGKKSSSTTFQKKETQKFTM